GRYVRRRSMSGPERDDEKLAGGGDAAGSEASPAPQKSAPEPVDADTVAEQSEPRQPIVEPASRVSTRGFTPGRRPGPLAEGPARPYLPAFRRHLSAQQLRRADARPRISRHLDAERVRARIGTQREPHHRAAPRALPAARAGHSPRVRGGLERRRVVGRHPL